MKIPLCYPKIPDSRNFLPKECVAFEKIDGTNIHFVWSPHRPYEERPHSRSESCCGDEGLFDWFGTRRDRFSYEQYDIEEFKKKHPELEDMPYCLSADMFDVVVFLDNNYLERTKNEVIVFTEYHGPGSFAGQHKPAFSNDPITNAPLPSKHKLTLLDVMVDGVFLPPDEFIKDFSEFGIPKVIYRGKFHGQFVEDVRNGKYDVDEGVVCKGMHKNQLYMCKIKTNKYMEKLKSSFKDDWKDYWE